jgi:hypothetical protein
VVWIHVAENGSECGDKWRSCIVIEIVLEDSNDLEKILDGRGPVRF